MTTITPRSARLLFASTLAIAALGAASALSAAEPAPRDAATGQASGKRMHKPYTLTAEDAACTAPNGQPTNVASDPEEGGQVTAAQQKGALDVNSNVKAGVASDPEEGGQVAAKRTKDQPTVSELTVSKRTDTASTKLMDAPAPTCPVQH